MKQSRKQSLIEQVCNVMSGMVIAYAVMQFILAPWLHIEISLHQNLWVTIILTVVSIIRGYIWRRFFNSRAKCKVCITREVTNNES